jgi:pentatricopeptide repeat protein
MCKKGINPNVLTYNTLIGVLCKANDVEKAKDLFTNILHRGLNPDGVTYATMIDGYCKSRNLTEAFQLLDEMPFSVGAANKGNWRKLMNYFKICSVRATPLLSLSTL